MGPRQWGCRIWTVLALNLLNEIVSQERRDTGVRNTGVTRIPQQVQVKYLVLTFLKILEMTIGLPSYPPFLASFPFLFLVFCYSDRHCCSENSELSILNENYATSTEN